MYVCLNGEFLPESQALISAGHAGLFYGAGCFETMRYQPKEIQFANKHFRRLCAGLLYLGVQKPQLPDIPDLQNKIYNLLDINKLNGKSVKVRVQCAIGNEQGYSASGSAEYLTLITVSEIPEKSESASLKTTTVRTVPAVCRPAHLKLSNMLHYRQAFRDARDEGFDDGLLLTVDGFVAETSIANIFWVKENDVFTPSVDCDILPGIIRNEVISYLEKSPKIHVHEGTYGMDELLRADAVWLTNSLMLVQPVRQINQHIFSVNHAVLNQIMNYFRI